LDSDDNIGNDDNDDTDSACSAMIEDGGLSNGKYYIYQAIYELTYLNNEFAG
jgi:hypothetical protein